MKKFLLSLCAILSTQCALASVLTLQAGGNSLEGVSISKSGTAVVDGRTSELQTVGDGLRTKQVAIVNVKVYVAQLLVSDASKFVHSASNDAALDSAASEQTVALQLDFLRSVSASQVQGAFNDSLSANQIDVNSAPIKAFLDAVAAGGDAENGKALTLVLEHLSDSQDAVTYEDSNGKATTITGPAGFAKQILSIWLGNTTDSGLASLKTQLIGH